MSNPERSEKAHLWLGRFWLLNFVAVTICYFYLPDIWEKVSILYLIYVSLYANAATEYGNSKAAKAARVSEDNIFKKLLRRFWK